MQAISYRSLSGVAMLLALAASARATTLTFDELAAQPVDGLSYKGVTFGFEVAGSPSLDATYNADLGLGSTAYTSDPVLEADAAGLLTVAFSVPSSGFSFGLLLLTGVDLTPGAVVSFYDAGGNLTDSVGLDTLADSALGVSGGLFSWSNPSLPASKAVVDFDDAGGRFALDNLTFSSQAVPEAAPLLGAFALSGLVLAHSLRRRQA